MIHHISLHVSDIGKAKTFYQKALHPLGYVLNKDFPEWEVAGFGLPDKSDLWLSANGIKGGHVAFAADTKPAVDAFHKAALEAGGKDNGAPGYRKEYAPGYYAAFVLDLDGNNIEVVFMDPNPNP
jgi:predicted lactoylglutathione lyase